MITSDYAHCITGQPPIRVLVHGAPLTRFDEIAHRDGSTWRYEGLCRRNLTVAATSASAPGAMRRFEMSEFGITVVVVGKAA